MNVKISAVILTRCEGEKIVDCISSVNWCDEIIIIIDGIKKPINNFFKKQKIKIYERKLNGDFSAQRNFGLSKTTNEWVLFVDSDEIVGDELRNEIKIKIQEKELTCTGFYIKRNDYFLGKWLKYGETGNVRLLRLARKSMGEWQNKVHEVWKIKGKTCSLNSCLKHFPHENISSFLEKINWYTNIVAQYWIEEKKKIDFWEIFFFPAGKFLQNYFFRLGFLDGIPGLIMAIMMSFHSFLARAKLWQKFNNE
uniref:Glycosyltransferase family 2 protein n=1 Tax=candidate division CPR3 bacterium TaxID=2268181 RepID=A0A7C4R3D2_UNCC3